MSGVTQSHLYFVGLGMFMAFVVMFQTGELISQKAARDVIAASALEGGL